MAIEQSAQKSLLDALYCDEEKWGEIDDDDDEEEERDSDDSAAFSLLPLDFLWDDEELQSLFVKERETSAVDETRLSLSSLSLARKEAVEWVLRINAHYGFSPLTAILAVNYLDRFLSSVSFPKEKKPWMMQLAAVTCLSLAAKVEETHVPLLLDLQVEGTKYVFEAKTIQKMELLVLSGLKWRMNPVTPLSFLDHIIRRLGLKSYIHWEFLRSSENLLLSVISDPRFTLYLPSVLATATMLHVIHRFEPVNAVDYERQLLGVLKISKEEVKDCYELITEVHSNDTGFHGDNTNHLKRKTFLNSDSSSSDYPRGLSTSSSSSSSSSCVSSSPHQTILKKRRVEEHQMRLPVFVDAVRSPH